MRIDKALSSLLVIAMLTSCSQSAEKARVYRYGDGRAVGIGSLGLHTYHQGETLWSIANAYHVDLRSMLDANALHAPYHVSVGERLRIPAPNTYKAQKGDTLYKISRMFDTTTTDIVALNHLKAPYTLSVDQVVRLPVKHAPPPRTIRSIPFEYRPTRAVPVPTQSAPQSVQTAQVWKPTSSQSTTIERETLSPLPQQQVQIQSQSSSARTSVPNQTGTSTSQQESQITDSRPLALSRKGFLKPVSGRLISGYGTTTDGLHNDGINIKAAKGDAVRSSEQGVVVYSGDQIEGYGNMLLIRHADGFMTAYAHMDKVLVKKGERVSRGQAIGTVGSTGHVSAPQLHFEIRKGRDAVNPSDYMNG